MKQVEGSSESRCLASDGSAILLVTKSAFAAAPHAEMRRIAETVAGMEHVSMAMACYSEQGQPSLRDGLLALREAAPNEILIVPLVLPLEPSFLNWITRSIKRWQAEFAGRWPPMRIARDIANSPLFDALLGELIQDAREQLVVRADDDIKPEGSLVPPQKRRVLVCEGGACNAAGADAIWGHLRNVQVARKLRVTGDGVMTAKATCLGPCNLAPVLQVFPEGTYYGGVTEHAIDLIAEHHLLGGNVVQDFAYEPTGRKQHLRSPVQNADRTDLTNSNQPEII